MDLKLTSRAEDFIDDKYFHELLQNTKEDLPKIREILAKSKTKQALTLEETATLLAINSPEAKQELFETAKELKRSIYGKRIVLFAPLYIGNYCINNCQYCGFRSSLRKAVRRTLSDQDIVAEVTQLEKEGHKRLILVYGEHPRYTPEFIADSVRTCYNVKTGNGEIRRININAAPLDIEGFRTVKEAGIGTFQVFQETYHKETYAKYHPGPGIKSDYMWRLNAMDRAFEAGMDDVGIGALFGLYDWRFEVLGLVKHSIYLQDKYGVGPHTISFPRIKPAYDMKLDLPYEVSDEDFKQLVATLRIAVPYTGLIMTARETSEVRDAVIEYGVSQIDAGTRLEIGGYHEGKKEVQELNREQFQIGDSRELDSVIQWLLNRGFIPSFCTSCYRLGRTGEHFMEYAIPGFIGRFCTPNAMLTLAEYLEDYSSAETKEEGYKLIEEELLLIKDSKKKEDLATKLLMIKNGKRDMLY
ncbi:MAG: [FeFe] hydrogenase H-cluster radical SAM maturase HydG [Bacteroidales bacterium]|jgi:2-iminoacetate synthase|nr:[FeFe] hydrogenase H-cluster radical SAM maturase HydG [Bacteroidales bacterium]MDD3299376.1 [FeFe] hydrogenase H-cluster radical SAM maturase HydG [Bacteroidales bacterium]MDD3843828.1 [FeFe] hydrogenase H-cluster radical SAM maturase HydG [Bacteroidales bacterium]MDD4618268.1 [FeFe] hydrogenase H-cluster radical SAM maturase HydG [Bacteroidales bacterium]